jgi:hypothetical protein
MMQNLVGKLQFVLRNFKGHVLKSLRKNVDSVLPWSVWHSGHRVRLQNIRLEDP